MQTGVLYRNSSQFVVICGLIFSASLSVAADPSLRLQIRAEDMVGTSSCTAVSCHGGGGPRYWSGIAKGAEYVHWLGVGGTYNQGRGGYDPHAKLIKTDGDPHAMAAQRMNEPRFQEVLRRASGRLDGSIDSAMWERCAKCHDPEGEARNAERGTRSAEQLEEIPAAASPKALTPAFSHGERGLSLEAANSIDNSEQVARNRFTERVPQGIGCETCHGGARQWLTVHYQTGIGREDLRKLGMVDTKDLAVRAKLCASCHVGSADQDMNHDMIAAGHPPLRFEQASYEGLLGHKHWDDGPVRSLNPNYEVQLWAAGRIAAAGAALELLEARCQESGVRDQRLWPEFAESNCLACHQPLRKSGSESIAITRLELRGRTPAWQSWNTALVATAMMPKKAGADELPDPNSTWAKSIEQLRSAMETSAFPDAQQVGALASQARKSLSLEVAGDLSATTALAVLQSLGEASQSESWDELCQRVAALAAVRRALEDQKKLDVVAADELQRRIGHAAQGLRFAQSGREWPVVYSQDPKLSTADVLRELSEIRQDLLAEARR